VIDEDLGRPTWCDIDLGAIGRNVEAIQDHVGVPVMPVIKADAYGHGAVRVAGHLEAMGVSVVGVAYVEEAIALRRAGIGLGIHVLGGAVERQVPLFIDHDLTFTAPSIDKLRQINAVAAGREARAQVHLKIDTGMERIGVHHYNAAALIEASLECESVDVEGIFSHFATSDAADLDPSKRQLERFHDAVSHYDRLGIPTPTRHMANSGAVAQLADSWLDMVRPGLIVFGVWPSEETERTIPLESALAWRSEVVFFKVVEAGSPVSYGSTWTPDRQVRIVTVPVGYGDGYRRSLSNAAEMLIGGKRRQVVGRVCMDQTMVNLDWGSAFNGDAVTLVGSDGDQKITVEDLATWGDTIPYEVLTSITSRVPRRYRI
jgi:alanine racemase